MSRSRKKVWGFKDRSPWAKRQANKKVRRVFDVPNGNAYRKIYNPWDICDYKCLFWDHNDTGWWTDKPWKLYSK